MEGPINDQSKGVGIGGNTHLIAEESTLSAESVDCEFSLFLSSTSFKFLTESNDVALPSLSVTFSFPLCLSYPKCMPTTRKHVRFPTSVPRNYPTLPLSL
jgi:hypothetical protein